MGLAMIGRQNTVHAAEQSDVTHCDDSCEECAAYFSLLARVLLCFSPAQAMLVRIQCVRGEGGGPHIGLLGLIGLGLGSRLE